MTTKKTPAQSAKTTTKEKPEKARSKKKTPAAKKAELLKKRREIVDLTNAVVEKTGELAPQESVPDEARNPTETCSWVGFVTLPGGRELSCTLWFVSYKTRAGERAVCLYTTVVAKTLQQKWTILESAFGVAKTQAQLTKLNDVFERAKESWALPLLHEVKEEFLKRLGGTK